MTIPPFFVLKSVLLCTGTHARAESLPLDGEGGPLAVDEVILVRAYPPHQSAYADSFPTQRGGSLFFPEERTYTPPCGGGTCALNKQKTSREEIVSRKVSNLFHSDKPEFVYFLFFSII